MRMRSRRAEGRVSEFMERKRSRGLERLRGGGGGGGGEEWRKKRGREEKEKLEKNKSNNSTHTGRLYTVISYKALNCCHSGKINLPVLATTIESPVLARVRLFRENVRKDNSFFLCYIGVQNSTSQWYNQMSLHTWS